MLATMGHITPAVVSTFPGFLFPSAGLKYADIPNGIAAISKVPQLGRAQIFAYCGFVECVAGFSKDITQGRPGELRWKVLTSSGPVEKTKKLTAEIANGRLAMMALIVSLFVPRLSYGQPLGRMGALHGFPFAGLRERAWRPGASGLLGFPGLRC